MNKIDYVRPQDDDLVAITLLLGTCHLATEDLERSLEHFILVVRQASGRLCGYGSDTCMACFDPLL
jgi:hypothetical protein